jgi:hypothetical protein
MEPQSRHADAHAGEVENLLDGNGRCENDQVLKEARESLRGIRRSLEERMAQWVDRRESMRRPLLTVEECFTKVKAGEMSDTDARNAVTLEIEEAYRFEQLMGNVHPYETPFRLFTCAMDWEFGEELNDSEGSLADQMKMWEQDELRKMQEQGLGHQSPFTQRRTMNGTARKKIWTWAGCMRCSGD